VTTSQKTLDQLEAKAAKIRTRLAEAEARAQAERQAAEQRRQQRLDAHDRATLAAYSDEELEQEVTAARQHLRAAILADPVVDAAAALLTAQMRRYDAYQTAGSAAARLGTQRAQPVATPPVAGLNLTEEMEAAVQFEASRRNNEERAQVGQARDDAGNADAGK
jgi:hypothetical protein